VVVFIINGLNIPLNDTDLFLFEHVLQKTVNDIRYYRNQHTKHIKWHV